MHSMISMRQSSGMMMSHPNFCMQQHPSQCVAQTSQSTGLVGPYSQATALSRKMILESSSQITERRARECSSTDNRTMETSAPMQKASSHHSQLFEPYNPSTYIDAVLEDEARELVSNTQIPLNKEGNVQGCSVVSHSSASLKSLHNDSDDEEENGTLPVIRGGHVVSKSTPARVSPTLSSNNPPDVKLSTKKEMTSAKKQEKDQEQNQP